MGAGPQCPDPVCRAMWCCMRQWALHLIGWHQSLLQFPLWSWHYGLVQKPCPVDSTHTVTGSFLWAFEHPPCCWDVPLLWLLTWMTGLHSARCFLWCIQVPGILYAFFFFLEGSLPSFSLGAQFCFVLFFIHKMESILYRSRMGKEETKHVSGRRCVPPPTWPANQAQPKPHTPQKLSTHSVIRGSRGLGRESEVTAPPYFHLACHIPKRWLWQFMSKMVHVYCKHSSNSQICRESNKSLQILSIRVNNINMNWRSVLTYLQIYR